jgi:hypothetical protein
MPCFDSHFENGRHLGNFENAGLLLVTIESYGKVEISYINVDKFYMDNDRDIQFNIVIGHH